MNCHCHVHRRFLLRCYVSNDWTRLCLSIFISQPLSTAHSMRSFILRQKKCLEEEENYDIVSYRRALLSPIIVFIGKKHMQQSVIHALTRMPLERKRIKEQQYLHYFA